MILEGFSDFRIRYLIENGQESAEKAEKFSEPFPSLRYPYPFAMFITKHNCMKSDTKRPRKMLSLFLQSKFFSLALPSKSCIAKSGWETGRTRFRRVQFQTPSSESFFVPHRVMGRELSEFLSAYYLRAEAN